MRVFSETIMDEVLAIISANLNAEIAAINADVDLPHSLVLNTVPSGGFFFQSLPPHVNINPWVLVFTNGPFISEPVGAGVAQEISINVALHDGAILGKYTARPDFIDRIFMRYTDAIRAIITQNFWQSGSRGQIKIAEMPIGAQYGEEPGESVQVAGMILTVQFNI